jgi:hypothetical protein
MRRLFGGDLEATPVHDGVRDRAAVEQCLPAATRAVVVDGVRGWLYPVTTAARDVLQLFLWFDGAGYQVTVASPDVSREDPHACHLYPHGRICLSADSGGGMPTLEGAFAKSVLWAHGFSVYQRTGSFPF